jgi:Flp pilus assembly secretin CpaC
MRAALAFTASIRRPSRIVVALVCMMMVASTSARPADSITVILDRARIAKVPDRTSTIVVGNPLIADVTIQSGGTMVVTGKGYGVTNLIALDRAGTVLAEQLVRVLSPDDSVVVYRGTARESYSCAPDCERRITLGDTPEYFDATITQAGSRTSKAQQSQTGSGPGAAR